MPRLILSDSQWNFLQKLFNRVNIGYIKGSDRLFFEGVLFRIRTGVPWRDLPT